MRRSRATSYPWVALALCGFVLAVTLGGAGGAVASPGNEVVSATPSENLPDDGPTPVVISGSGWEPGLTGGILQCAPGGYCQQDSADAVVGPDGTFSFTAYVSYDIGPIYDQNNNEIGRSLCYTSSTRPCELIFAPYTGEHAGEWFSVPITFAGHVKQLPIAAFTATPNSGTGGPGHLLNVQFDASGSYDPDADGGLVEYRWDFGDGQSQTATSPVTSHGYLPGDYTAKLRIEDFHGDSDTTTQQITVTPDTSNNTPPNAYIYDQYPATAAVGEEVEFYFYGNDLDGGVDLSLDFGDGSTPFLGDQNSGNTTHVYTQPGSYTPSITVTDEQGATTIYTGLHAIEVTAVGPPSPTPIVLDPPAPPEAGVWAWGENSYGQLGTGNSGWSSTPVRVSSLTHAEALAAGRWHSLALVDGEVWAWGDGEYGQLGTGTTANESTPRKVTGLNGVDAIAAGSNHSLALVDGEVWTWGLNGSGQLGRVTAPNYVGTTPAKVAGLTGVDAIAAGDNHSLALVDGEVWAWGDGYFGQLGDGVTSGLGSTWSRSAPMKVSGLTGADAIAAGATHSLALVDGDVWAWGYGSYLGLETSGLALVPVKVTSLSGVDKISAGGSHSFALTGGDAWGWGSNYFGDLGNGSTAYAPTPTLVSGLSGVDEIVSRGPGGLALVDGAVWAWGNGYLGNGTVVNQQPTPVSVSALADVTAVAGGALHALVVGSASPANGVSRGSAVAPPGGTVTSDIDGDGPTVENPLEVSVTTPNGGAVSIETRSEGFSAVGYNTFGRDFEIDAPPATADNPLTITIRLDASVFLPSYDLNWLYAFRDGLPITSPCASSTAADPDPCLVTRVRLANGDVECVIRSSHASAWTVLLRGLTVDAGGPYAIPEGSRVSLNGSASGGASPYSFVWDLAPGLSDPTIASPSFAGLDDGVSLLRLTATDSLGISEADESQVTVTNVNPSVDPLSISDELPVVGDQVSLEAAFSDPGLADTHTAIVNWGDGTTQTMTVTEQNGSGMAHKAHSYATPGSKVVTVTVTDDDGGQRQRQQTIKVLYGCVGPTPAGAIVRGTGNDTINGTEGDDVIVDAGGNNTINGRGGNDVICSGPGNDKIDAGAGNDVVIDAGGKNAIDGQGGVDTIKVSGSGANKVTGGAGDDAIASGAGEDAIDGGDGNDQIDAGDGKNNITGGTGNDEIRAGSGNDSVDGGAGTDLCDAGSGKNTVKNCEGTLP